MGPQSPKPLVSPALGQNMAEILPTDIKTPVAIESNGSTGARSGEAVSEHASCMLTDDTRYYNSRVQWLYEYGGMKDSPEFNCANYE